MAVAVVAAMAEPWVGARAEMQAAALAASLVAEETEETAETE